MKKYDYQTCLRLPVILKEEMSTICDNYQINESDLMRRAISQFVQTLNANPQDNGKLMFVWYVRYTLSEWGFSYQTDIPRTLHPQKTLFPSIQGLFCGYGKGSKNIHLRGFVSAIHRVFAVTCEDFHREHPSRLPIPRISCQTSAMRNLTATLCLTLAVLLGSVGVGEMISNWGKNERAQRTAIWNLKTLIQ